MHLQEYEDQMEELKKTMELERINKDKLQQDMDKLRAFYDTKLRNVDGQLADLPPTSAGESCLHFDSDSRCMYLCQISNKLLIARDVY